MFRLEFIFGKNVYGAGGVLADGPGLLADTPSLLADELELISKTYSIYLMK